MVETRFLGDRGAKISSCCATMWWRYDGVNDQNDGADGGEDDLANSNLHEIMGVPLMGRKKVFNSYHNDYSSFHCGEIFELTKFVAKFAN